ncbi:MAG: NYN domain-containing protein [Anaerolineae bacterium]|nr:NYN domain-containing protein [Anaerolineae bacterium]
MPYLIDGHNLIAALPDIDLDDPNDEARLVVKLRAWAAHARHRAVIVFDGGLPGGRSQTLSGGDLEVVFAARGYTNADRIIHERLRRLRDPRNWTVVSSDHEVLDAARRKNARVLTSQEFAEQLEPAQPVIGEKPLTSSPDEIALWLEVFGEAASAPLPGQEMKPSAPAPAAPSGHSAPDGSPARARVQAAPAAHASRPQGGRTIAEQIGLPVPDAAERAADWESREKPAEVTSADVAAWLEVFKDEPPEPAPPKTASESSTPSPSPTRSASSRRSRKRSLTVDKRNPERLDGDDLAAWLEVFPEPGDDERPITPSLETLVERRRKRPRRSVKLRKHRRQQADTAPEGTEGLSPEELATWYRLYGRDPDDA